MNATEIKNEGLVLHFRVIVPISEIADRTNAKLQHLSKTLKLPGFRPGKVPAKIVEQKYKASAVHEVLQEAIEEHTNKIIRSRNLKLATRAKVEDVKYDDAQDLEFVVIFERMPEIQEYDFSKIKIEKPLPKINDKDVEERIEELAASKVEYKKAAKTAKATSKDKVIINFEGFLDGVAFAGGAGKDFGLVLGSGTFIPGFEDQLIGAKAGDNVTVKVTFPENYGSKDLAGKATEFKVEVLEVQKPIPVEMNDELAKAFGVEDFASLKNDVKEMLVNAFKEPSFSHQKMALFNELEKMLDFTVPESLVAQEEAAMIAQMAQFKDQEEELKGKSEKEIEEYAKKIALRRVRIGLMLADYADRNSLKLTSDDYKEAIAKQARSFPGSEARLFEFYQSNQDALRSLTGPLLEEKAVKHILDSKVKLVEKEYTIEKFHQLIEELDA